MKKKMNWKNYVILWNFFSPVGGAGPIASAADDDAPAFAEPAEKSPLYCQACGTHFEQRGEFAKHMLQEHDDAKPFKCLKCKKAFTAFPSLTRHKQSCENTFMVFCPICNRAFHRKDYLSDHLKGLHKHYHKNFYRCKFCTKSFEFKSWLLTHQQTCQQPSDGDHTKWNVDPYTVGRMARRTFFDSQTPVKMDRIS